MSKLNTQDVVNEVSKRMGCYKKDTKELLQHFCDVIVESIETDKTIYFKPLGIFYPATYHSRKNNKGRKLRFKPSKYIIERLKNLEPPKNSN